MIDSHAHVTESGIWIYKGMNSSVERLLKENEDAGVKKSVIIAIDGYIANEYVLRICKKHTNRFSGYCSFNPNTTTGEQVFSLLNTGFVGIKMHPRLQNISINDKKIIQLFKTIEKKTKAILLIDAWFSEFDDNTMIKNLQQFVNEFDELKIILAHGGGFKYKEIMPLANKKNVFIDTALSLSVFKKHNKVCIDDFVARFKKIGCAKVLFGSDFPDYPVGDCVKLLNEYLTNHDFSEQEKKLIFGKNAEKILESS